MKEKYMVVEEEDGVHVYPLSYFKDMALISKKEKEIKDIKDSWTKESF